jgi:hypothetical protein
MTYSEFKQSPWRNSDPVYRETAFFEHDPAPEYATGEVLLSSLYRTCGFSACPERTIPAAGRAFVKRTLMPRVHQAFGSKLTIEEWQAVMTAILESPKQENQSSKRFLQMIPLVPDVALYSGSARLAGNPWNPGRLVQRMIVLGTKDREHAQQLWHALSKALDVEDDDDIWARWLHQEFGLRRESGLKWLPTDLPNDAHMHDLPLEDKAALSFPAQRFCADLHAILKAKYLMTRRQWTSLLESLLRLGSVAHVLWLCDVNARLWTCVRQLIDGAHAPSRHEVMARYVNCQGHYCGYGDPTGQVIRDYAARYLMSRIGLNAVLWTLREAGVCVSSLGSCDGVGAFLALVEQERALFEKVEVLKDVQAMQDEDARVLACKKGIGSNLVEFCRYSLAQRQTADESLRGYDQGYYLRKRGEYKSAPFVFSMGPAAILTLVHCCVFDAVGPRSIQALCRHMAQYGIALTREDVMSGELGRKLRVLGLVLDSPDAESGMLLVAPFNHLARNPHP